MPAMSNDNMVITAGDVQCGCSAAIGVTGRFYCAGSLSSVVCYGTGHRSGREHHFAIYRRSDADSSISSPYFLSVAFTYDSLQLLNYWSHKAPDMMLMVDRLPQHQNRSRSSLASRCLPNVHYRFQQTQFLDNPRSMHPLHLMPTTT